MATDFGVGTGDHDIVEHDIADFRYDCTDGAAGIAGVVLDGVNIAVDFDGIVQPAAADKVDMREAGVAGIAEQLYVRAGHTEFIAVVRECRRVHDQSGQRRRKPRIAIVTCPRCPAG